MGFPCQANQRMTGRLSVVGNMLKDVFYIAVKERTQRIYRIGGDRLPCFQAPNGGTADPAFDLQRIGCCLLLFHRLP